MPEQPSRNLAMELVRVTESAALAASRWVGRGDKNGVDKAAVDAMRTVLATVPMRGIIVIGEGEKMPAALIQPNFEFIKEWIDHKKLDIGTSNQDIISSEKVIKRIQKEVDKCNKNFGNWEQIKRFELTPDVWSIEGRHLTPTMKMKREIIKEIYKDLFDKIYRN